MFLIRFLFLSLILSLSTLFAVDAIPLKITQVIFEVEGENIIQNNSGDTPPAHQADHTPILLKEIHLDNIVIDNFAKNNISISNITDDLFSRQDKAGIIQSNGSKLPLQNTSTFKNATNSILNSTNIREYFTYDYESDYIQMFDIKYNGYSIDSNDYILYHERNGNNNFGIQALDSSGNLIGERVNFINMASYPEGKKWDSGYESYGVIGPQQHQWMGAISASQFDVGSQKIYGIRYWSQGADLKFYAMGEDTFEETSLKDFGDAPTNYPHVSHKISNNLYLGNSVPDAENDQQSSSTSTGDGADDNDGVISLANIELGASSFTTTVKVLNNSGKKAYITAWIDFNKNGIFEFNEALNSRNLSVASSTSTQNISINWDNFTDSSTFGINNAKLGKTTMRIRLSSSRILRCAAEHYANGSNLNYGGNYFVSPDGEIEDYQITIKKQPPINLPCGTVKYSTTLNNWVKEDSSPEAYDDNLNIQKTIQMSNATELRITVTGEIEHGEGEDYDWIYVYDENGNEVYKDDGTLNSTPFTILGSSVSIKLYSNGGSNGSGATIKIEGLGCNSEPTEGICYAIDDVDGYIYSLNMDPGSNSLPIGLKISLDNSSVFDGEAQAFRSKNGLIYGFNEDADSQDRPFLYSANPNTGAVNLVTNFYGQEITIRPNVTASSFYNGYLYIIAQIETEGIPYLYKINPEKNWKILFEKKVIGASQLAGLAINTTGKAYTITDHGARDIYDLNLETAIATDLHIRPPEVDDKRIEAEGLSFAKDGNLYVEDANEDVLNDGVIYKVDLAGGVLIPASKLPDSDNVDIEGLSCNIVSKDVADDEFTLIAEYRFDECFWDETEATVKDNSQNNLHGKRIGNTRTISQGKIGRAGYFNGDTSYIEISNNDKLQLAEDASWSLWVKPDQLSKGRQGLIFKHYDNEYELIMEENGKISFYHGDNRWEEMQEPNNAKVKQNIWSHIVVTRNTSIQTLTWYINGQKVGTDTYVKVPKKSNNKLFIGRRGSNTNYGFKGSIDEVKLFKGYLSDEKVTSIYNYENSGQNWDGEDRNDIDCIPPKINITDQNNTEGDSGTKNFNFNITLDKPSIQDITVKYKTTNGSALSGEDYTPIELTNLTFSSGETSKTVNIEVYGDTKVENNETFYVDLSSATNANILNSRGTGYIENDDIPNIHISDKELTEGNSGSKNFSFTITLDKASNKPVAVQYKTVAGTAFENEDYAPLSLTTLNFEIGETSKTINIKVKGDLKVEKDEIFYLHLSNATNSFIADDLGEGSILNDDKEIPAQLIAEYRFDECFWNGSENEVKDHSQNHLDGKAIGEAITISNGKVGRAGSFDGTADYIEIDNNTLLNPIGSFSVSTWFKAKEYGSWNGIVSKLATTPQTGWNIQVGERQEIASLQGDAGWRYLKSTTTPQTGEWYHAVMVHGRDNINKLYINGVLEKTLSQAIGTNSNPLHIAKFYTNANSLTFNGEIDEVKLFKGKLTDINITSIYNYENAGQNWDGTDRDAIDCKKGKPFKCSQESYLTTGSSSLYTLDLATGKSTTLQENYVNTHVNAIGYNVKDNFIWGWDKGSQKVMKLDANYTMTTYNSTVPTDLIIAANTGFTSGDISKDGILYLAKPSADPRLHKFDLNSGVPIYLGSDTLTSGKTVKFGDFAINPKDGYIYTSYNGRLYRISTSAVVEDLGKITGLVDFYFHSFVFDKTGTMYFYSQSNNKKVFKLDLSDYNSPDLTAEVFTTLNWVTASGDGARCVNAEVPQQPFTCTETLYLSNRSQLGTGGVDSGKTWLHSINRENKPFTFDFIGNGYTSTNGGYNAIGYNVKDDFIYAIKVNHLLRIDKNAMVKDLGIITGLSTHQRYAGEFDRDGYYYVSGAGGNDNTMYKIDINQKEVIKTITLSESVRFWDMAIDTTGAYFYAMLITDNANNKFINDKFVKINIETGIISTIGDSKITMPSTDSTDLIFADKQNHVYLMSNSYFSYIDTDTGEVYHVSETPTLTFYNDATSCPDANITAPSQITISDVNLTEGNTGTKAFNFTVKLNKSSNKVITVKYKTANGSALASEDYIALPLETLTFEVGETTKTITVHVKGDIKVENDETFYVDLSSATSSIIATGKHRGIGTIVNDDTPSMSIQNIEDTEGDSGLKNFTFLITLNKASNKIVTVRYKTTDGTALAGEDYTPLSSNTLSFAIGQISKSVTVQVKGDMKVEDHEIFYLDLSAVQNATLAKNRAIGKILNDDKPNVSINNIEDSEGNTGNKEFKFTIKLNKASNKIVTVQYKTTNNTAFANEDFESISLTTLTFAIGETLKEVSVQVNGDTKVEEDETFYLELLSSSNANLTVGQSQGIATILNDDKFAINISNIEETEGNTGVKNFTVPINIDQVAPQGGLTLTFTTERGDLANDDLEENFAKYFWDDFDSFEDSKNEEETTEEESHESDETQERERTWGESKKYFGSWFQFLRSWYDYRGNYKDQYSTYEDYYVQHLGKTFKTTDSKYHKSQEKNKKMYKEDILTITIPEGESSVDLIIPVQGDNEVEDNETLYINFEAPNSVNLSTPRISITIINDDVHEKLLSEYRFDACHWDGTANEVQDNSGNNNHLNSYGAIDTVPLGKIERSALFETNNHTIYGDVDIVLQKQITVNLWINTTINQAIGGEEVRVIELSRTGNADYSTTLAFRPDGKTIRGWTSNDANIHSTEVSFNLEDNGFFDGKWHLITYSYNDGEAKLYVDATLRETKVKDIGNISNTKILNIGGYSTGTDNRFYGKIDEIQIFNKALSIDKIKKIYNNINNGENWDGETRTAVVCAEKITPIAEYRFDCYMNGGYQDFSETNNTISTTKESVERENSSILCRAIDENNSEEKGVTVHDKSKYHVNNGSISFWIYNKDSISEINHALTKGAFNIGFKQSLANKCKIDIKLANGSHIVSNREYSVTESEWIFVTVTFEKHGYIKLFMDGQLEAKGVYDDSFNNGSKITAGEYFGQFDELYLFNGRMTEDEVNNLYQQQLSNKNLDGSSRLCDCSIYYPKVFINNIRKDEGDSNITIFTFAVNLNHPAPFNASLKMKVYDGTKKKNVFNAKKSDNDYNAQDRLIAVEEGATDFDIDVEVIGDIRMERDEIFYVELYDLVNLSEGNLTGEGTIANDDMVEFNIERVNSLDEYQKDSDFEKKTNLYTQISKKDFTYAIVSYEDGVSKKEEALKDITVKVELIDKTNSDESTNIIQTVVRTFNNQSRIDVPIGLGLENSVATRYAQFKISYPVDVNNTLMYNSTCTTVDCLESLPNFKEFRTDNSRDTFTIRPAGFKLMLWADDGTTRDHLATNDQQNGGALAAGYVYELQVKALGYKDSIEESFKSKTYYDNFPINSQKSLFQEVNASLIFNDKTSCNDKEDKKLEYYDFVDGINSQQIFKHSNVGNYIIKVLDENWTNRDHINPSKIGCILDSTSNQANSDGLFGCNIGTSFNNLAHTYYDMDVYFQPYYFDVNLSVTSRLNSGHNDFLYMSNLSKSNEMAISIDGNITAKAQDGNTTTNFTQNCLAHKVDLHFDYSVVTNEGEFNNTKAGSIKTIKGTAVDTQRKIKYNSDNYQDVQDNSLGQNIPLETSDFKDNNKGSSSIRILYNVEKSLNDTINPIEIEFHKVHIKSEASISNLADNEKKDFIPKGKQNLNTKKVLYFARMASDLENYPLTYKTSKLTPLNVEIFCDGNMTWCKNIMKNNNNGLYTTRNGWYTSFNHNSAVDGGISSFNINHAENITITPFTHGRISNIMTTRTGTGNVDTRVEVTPNKPWLNYHPTAPNGIPFWENHFRTTAPSQWSGLGKTGRVIDSEANSRASGKMDW